MIVVWILCILVFIAFTFVVAVGAPFLPTLNKQVPKALDLINLKPGQTLLELGSGDGRVLAGAAERGIRVIGYELNPLLVIFSWLRTWKYRRLVTIRWRNFWQVKLPPTDGIFVFLLNPYMKKLDNKIIQESQKSVRLVSFAFQIPDRQPNKVVDGMYLYKYKK